MLLRPTEHPSKMLTSGKTNNITFVPILKMSILTLGTRWPYHIIHIYRTHLMHFAIMIFNWPIRPIL